MKCNYYLLTLRSENKNEEDKVMNWIKTKCMKKLNLLLIKSLLTVFAGVLLLSCGEESLPVAFYPISKVSRLERDSVVTLMKYGNAGLSEYNMYIHNSLAYKGDVWYTPSSVKCLMNGIQYDFQLANTKGVSRVESLTASMGNAKLYSVQYYFEEPEGRITGARIDGVEDKPCYVKYKYVGNRVIIEERGWAPYEIELSSIDNLGYVCNVLDFAGAEYSSKYVINSDFYFLNIYGTPIKNLPQLPQDEIEISEDNQRLLRVGKYSYDY